jgi:transposase
MESKQLEELVLSLQNEITTLKAWAAHEIAKRDKVIAELKAENDKLKAEIVELKAKLNANSKNSSKPPSSDGLKKPASRSLREPSSRKKGGQNGHEGHGFKMMQKVDFEVACLPSLCQNCAQRHECAFRVRNRRNVIDISVKLERTEYQQMEALCPCRNNELLIGEFPADAIVSKQYGHKIKALGVALVTECAVSFKKASQLLREMTSCTISASSLVNFLNMCKSKMEDPLEYIRREVLGSAVVNFDETYLRVNGKQQYMHTASTPDATYQSVDESRGKTGMDNAGILPYFTGIAIHDCWGPYWNYEKLGGHGGCCAHLLRECKGLHEMYPQSIFFSFFPWLLTSMLEAKKKRMAKGKGEAGKYYMRRFLTIFSNAVKIGQVQHPPIQQEAETKRGRKARGKANAFIKRMERLYEAVCLFFCDFSVPFDNNLAERDLRHAKVKQKVSGCFRTDEGAKLFAKFNSYLSTAKKRGCTSLRALELLFQGTPMLALGGATE